MKPTHLAAWSDAEAGRFALFLPVAMAAGVVAYFALTVEPPWWPAPLLAAALLPAARCLRHLPAVRAACLTAALAACGFASAERAGWAALPWAGLPRHAVVLAGDVAAVEPLATGRRIVVTNAALDGAAPLRRTLRIRLRDSDPVVLAAGDRVQVRALIRVPAPPGYPGGWDTQRDAYFAGVGGSGFAIGPATRLAVAPESRLQAMREAMAARIMATLPGARGAIAATLMTGIGSAIPAEDRAAFAASGLAHLLAVAGLHGGIVMGLVYAGVRRGLALSERAALFWPVKPIAAVAALLAGLFYLALTGAHVPILRSLAMASLVTLALLTGRGALSMRALAVAALILMLAAPDLVMGVSFQMSFAAVLALVAGWEALSPWMRRRRDRGWHGVALYAPGLALSSALAGTATLPVAAYHFGTACLYYVPANLLAVPVTAFWVMPWGLLALGLMPLGLSHLALTPMGWGVAVLCWLAHGVAAWPFAVMPVPQMPAAALVLMLAGLIWLCLWRTRVRLAGLAPVAAGLVAAAWAPLPDVVVSPDARLIAARVSGRVYVSSVSGVSRYDRKTPGRIWGVDGSLVQPLSNMPGCAARACRLTLGRRPVLIWAPDAACDGMALIVAHGQVSCPAAGVLIVDKAAVETDGGTTIRLTPDGAVVRTVAGERGHRPWVIGSDLPAAVRLPMAPTE